jgi:hypothetical protein
MNYRKMVTQLENSSEALSSNRRAEYSPIIPASLLSVGVEATSQNLGWRGLQAVRYRDLGTNEIQIPSLFSTFVDPTYQAGTCYEFEVSGR